MEYLWITDAVCSLGGVFVHVGVMKNPRTSVFGGGVSAVKSRDPTVGRVRRKMSQGKDSWTWERISQLELVPGKGRMLAGM